MAPKISSQAKEEKKLAILKAALECFSQKGYHATSVDDVVNYTNLSKGSIYNYFSSKEEMFISLITRQTEETMHKLQNALQEFQSPTEKLKYLVNLDIPFRENKRKMMRVMIEFWTYSADNEQTKDIMVKRFQKIIDLTKGIFEEGKAKGEFRKDLDAEVGASMYWGLHDGIWVHSLVLDDPKLVERKIKELEETILRYVK